MTQEKVNENPHAERLNGIIKNNYLYPYAPSTRRDLWKCMQKAVWMYNNQKPHQSIGNMTPVQYREITAIDNENNSSGYYPLPTAIHNHHIKEEFNYN
jgi:hypothetical protein